MIGYRGIGPDEGIFVPEEKAYEYALERCISGTREDQEEFRRMLVEWFYSGNWVEDE